MVSVLKFPSVILVIIFIVISIWSNLDSFGLLTSGETSDEDKLVIAGKIVLLTPYRFAHSAMDSFTLWQQTGNAGALGATVLYGAGLVLLFMFLHGLVGWVIGFFHPVASEERKSFIAFVAVLSLIALAVSFPFDPNLVVSVILLLFMMWILLKLLKRKFRKKKIGERA